MERNDYCVKNGQSRDLSKLEASIKRYQDSKQYLHLSFAGDPYDLSRYRKSKSKDDTNVVTRQTLELCLKYKVPVQILTKGGLYCVKDGDLFERFGKSIRVGQSLTFFNPQLSRQYEPNAAVPQERLDALAILKHRNIPTWASFEPVIDSGETLTLLQECLDNDLCDYYRIGAFSPSSGLKETPKQVDWEAFASVALKLINRYDARAYFKKDLRELAPIASRELTPYQSNPDAFIMPTFKTSKIGASNKTSLTDEANATDKLGEGDGNDDFKLPDKTQNNFRNRDSCQ
jgi:DNA repair photolyase